MNFSFKVRAAEACLNLVLATVSPLQSIFDRPGFTHEFCNRQALSILMNDGYSDYAEFLSRYAAELNFGVYWADSGWKNVHHYYNPVSGKGLWNVSNALDTFEIYYARARSEARQYNFSNAVFFLGASAHLLQDLCVPHHARAKLFCGHRHYENWVQLRCGEYAVISRGIYAEGRPIRSLLLANASMAAELIDWVKNEDDESRFSDATEIVLAVAQRATAGLFRHFAAEVFQLGYVIKYPWLFGLNVA
ncbi:MAG: zinc dependent phospholipase C family protein [Negativicutes bacterium]|nr:zinc dependent phospholipase C family protein [Negativicutes bacterium]